MPGKLEGIHVLVVDDDPDIQAGIALALRTEGATTETAADGAAAIRAVTLRNPDLVVLDVMLPAASGFVVLEKIRSSEDPPPVIMVTANQGRRHQEYARSLGADAYFCKPVPLSKLIDRAVELVFEEIDEGASTATTGPPTEEAPTDSDRDRPRASGARATASEAKRSKPRHGTESTESSETKESGRPAPRRSRPSRSDE